MIGAEDASRAVIERARLPSTIALKEEALLMLQNAEASAAQIGSMEREIALLRERQGLIGQRATRDTEVKAKDDQKKVTEDLRSDLSSALQRASEDTKNPIKSFAQALASTVYSRLTKSLADSMADGLLGPLQEAMRTASSSSGESGFLRSLLGAAIGGVRGGFQASFSQTAMGSSGFGTALAYQNHRLRAVPSQRRPCW